MAQKRIRIAMIGQQDFGKAVLDAFMARGDTVAGVFCAPEKPNGRPDALRAAAAQAGVPVFQPDSLQTAEARDTLKRRRRAGSDGVRASVRSTELRDRSALRHDSISPVPAPAVQGTERHQLAHHSR